MKRYLFVIPLIVSLVASPVLAEHRQVPHEKVIKWAGCQAQLVTSDVIPIAGSAYAPYAHTLYIGTLEAMDTPEFVHQIILFHEIGHCLQFQDGVLYEMGTPDRELDADRWAADLACAIGLDGRQMLHDVMVWAKKTFDYDGDYAHGTLQQRIEAGNMARWCEKPDFQAPWFRLT
jgi:hypothetical protein